MLRKSLSLCVLLHLLSVFAFALPAVGPAEERRTESLVVRQNDGTFSGPTTVTTQSTLQTASGPMLQTCTLTFTPVTGANGEPLVQEVSSCVVEPASASSSAAPASTDTSAPSSAASTDTAAPSSTPSTDSAAASSSVSSPGSTGVIAGLPTLSVTDTAATSAATSTADSTSVAASASASDSASSSASAPSGATSAADTVPTSASASATDSSASSATASPSASAIDPANNGAGASSAADTPTSTSTDGAAASGTSAADSASSSAAPFKLPGTTLSVLPIGLAVFAGISVIALIVVGLVTYERTKYRRAFRQRKLAESGASMGYGGMA